MKVLSLFDGISCGMIALQRAGVKVERYVSYEIEDNAIKVSKANFNTIEYRGNVIDANFRQYKDFELLIGGSPCQDLCVMGKRTGLRGDQSSLFYEFLRAKLTIKPKYFLLENNASMTQQNKEKITDFMGVEPMLIDSGDFCAQTRKRLYWTNIPIKQYAKKNLTIKDILEKNAIRKCVDDKVYKYVYSGKYEGRKISKTVKSAIREPEQKSRTLGCNAWDIGSNTGLVFKLGDHYYIPTQTEFERLQTLPDGYTSCLDIKNAVSTIGNGWTIDVIAHIFKGLIENEANKEEKTIVANHVKFKRLDTCEDFEPQKSEE